MKQISLLIIVFLGTLTSSFSQDSTQSPDASLSLPFYKWEVGIDLLPIVDKGVDPFGILFKRNYQDRAGRRALRLKLRPRSSYSPLVDNGYERTLSGFVGAGYEWQRMHRSFSFHYGGETSLQYTSHKIVASKIGTILDESSTAWSVNGFIAGRYYVSNHISVTLETHLTYQYLSNQSQSTSARSFYQNYLLNAVPIQAIYLSYLF